MENNFKSLDELYAFVKPALYSKLKELYKLGLDYAKEEDIWNYLSETSWRKTNNLSIHDMVSDIMNIERDKLECYLLKMFKNANRELIKSEDELL